MGVAAFSRGIKLRSAIKNTFFVILGTFVLAFGTSVLIIPFDLVTGGVSGIGIILHRLFSGIEFLSGVSSEIYASVVNWGLFFLGLIFLGKSFALKTLVSTLSYPVALSLFSFLAESGFMGGFFDLLSDKYASFGEVTIIIAAVFGGACIGAGCALTFLGGGSTGGVDILALIFCKYVKTAKSSSLLFIIDSTIVTLGLFVFGNLVLTLLGIVSAFICSITIDRLFIGESRAFMAYIVTDKHEELNRTVIEKLDRTTTLIDAVGGYSGQNKKMVMVSFNLRQYTDFLAVVASVDRYAFVTIHRAHEINGEGWTYQK